MGRYDERRLWSNVGSEGEGPASGLCLTVIDIGCKDRKRQDGLAAGRTSPDCFAVYSLLKTFA